MYMFIFWTVIATLLTHSTLNTTSEPKTYNCISGGGGGGGIKKAILTFL